MIDQLPLTIGMVLAGLVIGLIRLRGARPEAIQQQIKTLTKPANGNGNGNGKYLELITRLQGQVETTRDTRIETIELRMQSHTEQLMLIEKRMDMERHAEAMFRLESEKRMTKLSDDVGYIRELLESSLKERKTT